jgi:hypothetical protein
MHVDIKTLITLFILTALIIFSVITIREFSSEKNSAVYDLGRRLTKEVELEVAQYHKEILEYYDIDYRLYTLFGRDWDLDEHAQKIYKKLNVGSLSSKKSGILVAFDVMNHTTHILASPDIQHYFPNEFAVYLQNEIAKPYSANYRLINNGAIVISDLILKRIDDQHREINYIPLNKDDIRMSSYELEKKYDRKYFNYSTFPRRPWDPVTPEEIMITYFDHMQARNNSPDLPIYSKATRIMLMQTPLTDTQMQKVVMTLRRCPLPPVIINNRLDKLAVLSHPIEARNCPPFFFVLEKNSWKLDLVTFNELIRFNKLGDWHFVEGFNPHNSEYKAYFKQWVFDKRGFPYPHSY